MSRASWSAAVRIARRDALRHRGRSALIVAMVALPVLGMTAADILARTAGISVEEKVARQFGQADAVLAPSANGAITQDDRGTGYTSDTASSPPDMSIGELKALLPAGSHVMQLRTGVTTTARAGDLAAFVETSTFDYTDPLARGMIRQRSGHAPRTRDEVVVTSRLADTLGVKDGDTIQLGSNGEFTRRVVGTYIAPESTHAEGVIGLPGSLRTPNDVSALVLVDLPPGADAAALVPRLNEYGVVVQTRDMLLHPAPPTAAERALRAGLITVIVGLATLEVVLLAGAAFAVGARRQRRDLALVEAAGATKRQVRSVVLASGGVLGLAGGIVGVALGVPVALVARGPTERFGQTLFGPLDIRPLELVAIMMVGTLTGVVAAAWPARTAARVSVVAALSGRRGVVRTPAWLTIASVITTGIGVAIAAYGASATGRSSGGAADATGQVYLPQTSPHFTLILAGAVIAELGLVGCVPAVLGLIGRGARWLPLSPRLAVRDVARQRARSGPAVAAIMAALAGSVAIATYLASSNDYEEGRYTPQGRTGQAFVYLEDDDPSTPPPNTKTLAAAAAALPTRTTATIVIAYPPNCSRNRCPGINVQLPPSQRCPVGQTTVSTAQLRRLAHDPRCATNQLPQFVGVGTAHTVDAILGHPNAAAAAALSSGKAVALDPRYVVDGRLTLLIGGPGGGVEPRPRSIPAVGVQSAGGYELPAAILPMELAQRLHFGTNAETFLIDTRRTPTNEEQARAQSVLTRAGWAYEVRVERGFDRSNTLIVLVLVGVAALITLGATVIATTLAGAEAGPDLATLAAVGAPPRVRRLLAAAQAGAVAGIGALFGVCAGLVPGLALVHARPEWPTSVPWSTLTLTVVGLPVVGAALAAAFTRARLPMHARST